MTLVDLIYSVVCSVSNSETLTGRGPGRGGAREQAGED